VCKSEPCMHEAILLASVAVGRSENQSTEKRGSETRYAAVTRDYQLEKLN